MLNSASKLAKEYDMQSESEYYDMIIDSMINGQFTQFYRQYLTLDIASREEFTRHCAEMLSEEDYLKCLSLCLEGHYKFDECLYRELGSPERVYNKVINEMR